LVMTSVMSSIILPIRNRHSGISYQENHVLTADP
jgi:hypothetical protein